MKISTKGRYALAAAILMAQRHGAGEPITVLSIAEKLGLSKIYLEQVFSLLKRGGIVHSIKGSQGGYQLSRAPRQITMLDILSAAELSLFLPTEDTVAQSAPEIESALRTAFDQTDEALKTAMERMTLEDLKTQAENARGGFMFYI